MRVVLDTNTLVSGVISPAGPPRRLLNGVRSQAIELCSSATLLAELLDVLSREKFARGGRAGFAALVLRPAFRFVRMYVLRLGFLDGWAGFQLARLEAFGVFLKYAKLRELARSAPPGPGAGG